MYERSPRPLEQRGAGIGLLEATSRYLVGRTAIELTDISIVYRHLMDRWGNERYRLGHDMVSFEQSDSSVVVLFANGEREEFELLVCADGVGSTARQQLLPNAASAYAGYVAWRGMVPESDLPPEIAMELTDAITYHVYANSHILVYPIPGLDGSVVRGERLINFVWYRNYLEGPEFDELMTDRHGDRRDLSLPPGAAADHHTAELRASARAHLPPLLASVVAGTAEPFLQVVYDIEVDRMVFARVVLLGDAAFAVRPHAAAGTAKAAEDGWVLVDSLGSSASVPEALAAWESKQIALGRDLLERTRRIGRRSQIDNTWIPGDPEFIFGLHQPGDQ